MELDRPQPENQRNVTRRKAAMIGPRTSKFHHSGMDSSSSSTISDEVSVSYKMKKKILVERNGVNDVELMKKSGSLRCREGEGVSEPSPPKPRYLRYKPHRSKDIFTRIQKVVKVRSAEIIEERKDDFEEEENGCSSLKGLLKLLCLVYVLMHWSSCMSNTNSSSSFYSTVHVLPIIGGKEGYYWRNQTLTTYKSEECRTFGEEEADESLLVLPKEEIPVEDDPNYYSSEEISNSVLESLDSWVEEEEQKKKMIVDKSSGGNAEDNNALIPPADEECCSTDLDQLFNLTTANLKEEQRAENPPLQSSTHMMFKTVAVLVSVLVVVVVVVVVCCYFKKKKPTTANTTTAAAAAKDDDDLLLSASHVTVRHGGPTVELISELEFHFQLPQNNKQVTQNSRSCTTTTTTATKKKKTATDADDEATTTTKVDPTPTRRSTRLHNRLPTSSYVAATTPKSFR